MRTRSGSIITTWALTTSCSTSRLDTQGGEDEDWLDYHYMGPDYFMLDYQGCEDEVWLDYRYMGSGYVMLDVHAR